MSDPAHSNNEGTKADNSHEPNVAIPDTDYLRFGWWTKVDKDGDVTLQTFFGGDVGGTINAFMEANGNVEGLEGTARYNGPAGGRYAVKTFNSNGTLDSLRHGEFTAAAALTASFGGNTIAPIDRFSINGEITGFVSESGDDLDAWSLSLEADLGPLDAAGVVEAPRATAMFSGANANKITGGLGGAPVTSGALEGCILRQSC